MTTILFYEEYAPYGYFSNFASCPILLKGRIWPTTEHYYQAQKYAGTDYEEAVRLAWSPMTCKDMTRDPLHPPRPDWAEVRDGVMREALVAKFTQYPNLRALLAASGDAVLVEHTANDHYWADGGDGSGRNMLGTLLMAVRDELHIT